MQVTLYETKQGICKIATKLKNREQLNQFIYTLRLADSITHLIMYQNDMGDEFAIEIAHEIKKKRIQFVYYWANDIGDTGAKGICEILASSTVTFLDLSRNRIGDDGAIAISKSFTKHSSISGIDLSFNSISEKGAISIANQIGKTLFLSKLNLSHNKVGDKGIDAWLLTLKTYRFLYETHFYQNDINPSKIVLIESLNEMNKSIRQKQAAQLRQACRNSMIVSLPLPPELTDIILGYCTTAFTYSEAKLLLDCFLEPCFVGLIHSTVPFSVDELIRRCICLMLYRPDFRNLYQLKVKQRDAKQQLAILQRQQMQCRLWRVIIGIALALMICC
jgi:hypothetical protein